MLNRSSNYPHALTVWKYKKYINIFTEMANYMICLMIKNSIKYINFHVYPQLLLLYSLTTITVAEVPLFDTVGL